MGWGTILILRIGLNPLIALPPTSNSFKRARRFYIAAAGKIRNEYLSDIYS